MNTTPPTPAADVTDELIAIAREIEALKQECGMDPESPRAIQNSRYMNIAYKVRALALRPAPVAATGKADEVEHLRELAACCYAGLGGECDLPEAWLDALSQGANGQPFSTEGLLPYTAGKANERDAANARRYRWLRNNREARKADGTMCYATDEDGSLLYNEQLDAAIDAAIDALSTPETTPPTPEAK